MVAMMPAAETTQTENTAFSRKVSRMWGFDLHSWEQWMLLSLGFAALAAVAVVVATTAVVVLQRRETAQATRELEEYKLSVESKVADAKKEGIEAGKTAGNALVRAAELERDAANARLETEKLKVVVAWRTLSESQTAAFKKAAEATPGSVNLRWQDGDPEAMFLAIQISNILGAAHWNVAPGSFKPANSILFGVVLPPVAGVQADTLREALRAAQLAFSSVPISGQGASFNVSTIPDAPFLYIGSRLPVTP
jgi:hypothetical protein